MRYNETVTIHEAPANKTLLESLRSFKIPVPFSCGGEGICTTCRIILVDGQLTERTELEAERARERGFESTERLSCQCKPMSDTLDVKIP